MFKECIAVLALIAVVYGTTLEKRGYGYGNGGCGQVLQCVEDIEEVQLTEIEGVTDEEALDHICAILDDVRSCISNANCRDVTASAQVKAVMDVAEYLCSPHGREVVLDLAQSPCATDEFLQLQLQISLQGCMQLFEGEVEAWVLNAMESQVPVTQQGLCPFVDNLKTCMEHEAATQCGSGFGDFVSTIWDISAGDQFAMLGCTQDATVYRRMITKTIPLALKRAALIAKRR